MLSNCFPKFPWRGHEVLQQLDWSMVFSQQLPSYSVFFWCSVQAFHLLLIRLFLPALFFFFHCFDTCGALLSLHRCSLLLFFVLQNYDTFRWPHHVKAFIVFKNFRLILESHLLAPIQCHNRRRPQESAWGKARGWPQLFKWLELLYTTGICWVLSMPPSPILGM